MEQNFILVGQGKPLIGFTMLSLTLTSNTLLSSSAPAFAGIVSLLNSARLSANQKPLGFLNPFIYKYGYRGLNDIVNGKSSGCTGIDRYTLDPAPYVPGAGWGAVEGWDPVTVSTFRLNFSRSMSTFVSRSFLRSNEYYPCTLQTSSFLEE